MDVVMCDVVFCFFPSIWGGRDSQRETGHGETEDSASVYRSLLKPVS